MVNYVIVEDVEALETGLVLLLFLDDRGCVARRFRLSASKAEQVGGAWLEFCGDESYYWVEADVGENYFAGCTSELSGLITRSAY